MEFPRGGGKYLPQVFEKEIPFDLNNGRFNMSVFFRFCFINDLIYLQT